MKLWIVTLLALMVLTILYNKCWIPKPAYIGGVVLVSLVAGQQLWSCYSSMVTRNNMNYNQIEWGFDPSKAAKVAPENTNQAVINPWDGNKHDDPWLGQDCCSMNQYYDNVANKCKPFVSTQTVSPASSVQTTTTSTTVPPMSESFLSAILTKTQTGKYKGDYSMQGNLGSL